MEWLREVLAAEYWNAITALATCAAAIGLVLAAKQLSFDAWNKAQDLIRDSQEERARLFRHIDGPTEWTSADEVDGALVCRNMTELCRFAPYLAMLPFAGQRRLLRAWDEQIARSWVVLSPLVASEYDDVHGSNKWDAFSKMGEKALARLARHQPDLHGYLVGVAARMSKLPKPDSIHRRLGPPQRGTTPTD